MKVNRGREEGRPSVQRTETVTGEMWGDPLLSGDDVLINSVFFAPRARTHWHRTRGCAGVAHHSRQGLRANGRWRNGTCLGWRYCVLPAGGRALARSRGRHGHGAHRDHDGKDRVARASAGRAVRRGGRFVVSAAQVAPLTSWAGSTDQHSVVDALLARRRFASRSAFNQSCNLESVTDGSPSRSSSVAGRSRWTCSITRKGAPGTASSWRSSGRRRTRSAVRSPRAGRLP